MDSPRRTYARAGGTANRYRDLLAGKHEATLLRTPFELLAANRGYRQLATAEALGPYQGTAGIARRSWAREHEAALVGFLRAYKAGVDWLYDRANRDVVEALLVLDAMNAARVPIVKPLFESETLVSFRCADPDAYPIEVYWSPA
jgi:hypothetical protein